MTDEPERRDVTDDVRTMMTSPGGRYDFSITSLLSSSSSASAAAASERERSKDKRSDSVVKQLQLIDSASSAAADGIDSTVLLHQRLAAAALWYPWLHGVASLQSAANRLNHGKLYRLYTFHCQYSNLHAQTG